MECEKCQDRGFVEFEHGLIMAFCDCGKGKALRAEITGEVTSPTDKEIAEILHEAALRGEVRESRVQKIGEINDNSSSSGIGQPDNITRSADTSKPKQPRKQKKGKGTTKRTR